MALILPVQGKHPVFGRNCFLAENATITGDVVMGDHCSVWFHAVIRGDVHFIRIGNNSNIQDGAVIHCTYRKAPTQIGNSVSIAHNAVVHGCTIDDRVLIGMGAIVMDHVHVQEKVIIAAGAVVLADSVLESGFIYAGVPARKVKEIEKGMAEIFEQTAKNYIMYGKWYE